MNIYAFQLNNSHIHSPKKLSPSFLSPKPPTNQVLQLKPTPSSGTPTLNLTSRTKSRNPANLTHEDLMFIGSPSCKIPRWVFVGGASLGLAILILGVDGGQHEALAFGPEGPLVEEFWDNMRRYGLYILTVSTGFIYTIFQPIVELLKNPITAILIITLVVGSGYLLSQILNAMVGISDFSYSYSY